MEHDRFDRLAKRLVGSAASRRALIAGAAGTLLALLCVTCPEAEAALTRKRKPQKKRCPRTRRCGRRCCTRTQECCNRACRAKCPTGSRRNPQTCRCDPLCLAEETVGEGPFCIANSDCCSGVCGATRGEVGTCRIAACVPPTGACTTSVQCCEGFCVPRDPLPPSCVCAVGRQMCGGQCLSFCPEGFIRDAASCECRCRAVDEACPSGGVGGIDGSCCSGECGCVTSDNCTCRKAACVDDNEICFETSDCCRGTCVRIGAFGRCER